MKNIIKLRVILNYTVGFKKFTDKQVLNHIQGQKYDYRFLLNHEKRLHSNLIFKSYAH